MTRDQWRRIKTIAAGALDQPVEGRTAFVSASCGDDMRLRQEVESLLESIAEASPLFESPSLSIRGSDDN